MNIKINLLIQQFFNYFKSTAHRNFKMPALETLENSQGNHS